MYQTIQCIRYNISETICIRYIISETIQYIRDDTMYQIQYIRQYNVSDTIYQRPYNIFAQLLHNFNIILTLMLSFMGSHMTLNGSG